MKLAFVLILTLSSSYSQRPRPPIAFNPVVTIEGTVQKVQISPGYGMPYVDVTSGDRTVKVYLGPMRYLMEQNFNPKVGTQILVKAYKTNTDLVAISVTLSSESRTYKLRDEDGFPLWRGRRMMHGMAP